MAVVKPTVTSYGLGIVQDATNKILEYIFYLRTRISLTDAVTDEELKDLEIGDEFVGSEVTTSHFIPKKERDHCQNPACSTSFQYPSLRRPHHCRRCGEIFCTKCLQSKRRLNIMAQPDPLGVLCKVCPSCYDDRGLELGCTKRSLTKVFLELREMARAEMEDIKLSITIESRPTATEPVFWKQQVQIDILKECQRLIHGFQQNMNNLETLNDIYQLQKLVKTPSWQKSTFWKLDSRHMVCRECAKRQEGRNQMKNCKVCGLAVCKQCSHKELLLYFEDGTRPGKNTQAKLAIIRLQGCPEKEPKFSMLLHCCTECKEEISRFQTEDEEWYMKKSPPPDFETEFARYNDEMKKLTENISNNMDRLSQAVIDMEEREADKETYDMVEPPKFPEIDTVNFLQEELNQQIQFYWNQYTELKSLLKTNTDKVKGRVLSLTNNYMRARSEFYVETKSRLSRTLTRSSTSSSVSPAET